MTTVSFITELFCRFDDALVLEPIHPQANLFPRELVTLGTACGVFGLKGIGHGPFTAG